MILKYWVENTVAFFAACAFGVWARNMEVRSGRIKKLWPSPRMSTRAVFNISDVSFPLIILINILLNGVATVLYDIAVSCPYALRMQFVSPEGHIGMIPVQIILLILWEDIWFYSAHRIFHKWKWGFRNIHSIHHMWTDSHSFVSLYSHPVEHILCNLWPVFSGGFVVGLTWNQMRIWTSFAMVNAALVHSGVDWLGHLHQLHHDRLLGNYGVIGICDRLFGTSI